jgi:hypothetical protein
LRQASVALRDPAPSLPPANQVLIIDADDVLRGRLACGLFERVAEWNGYGRVLLPWTCGVDADQDAACGSLATQVSARRPSRRAAVHGHAMPA